MPNGLGIYLTGASADGLTQMDPASCLGGCRSAVSLRRLGALITDPIAPIRIDHVSGDNGEGAGTLVALDADTLQYTAPGGTAGTAVEIANGETAVIADTDADKWIQVTRESDDDLSGSMTLDLVYPLNSVVGGSNTTAAGGTEYHGLMIRASAAVSDLYVWIGSGLSVAFETADADNEIQTIASLTTAPTAVSWDSGTTEGTGLYLASLASGVNLGLWLRRVVAAASAASAGTANTIHIKWTAGGETYTETITGLYLIADAAGAQYELYVGQDADPDLGAAPSATAASETIDHALAAPPSGTREYRAALRHRNAYGLTSANIYSRPVALDSTGAEVVADPTAPVNVTATDDTGGSVLVAAEYQPTEDASPADTWRVYSRGDGVDPVPGTDTPTETTMAARGGFWSAGYQLNTTVGPYPLGADVRVLVTAYRASDSGESDNTTASSITVGTTDPAAPQVGRLFVGNLIPLTGIDLDSTTEYDATYSVEAVMTPGVTDFKVGATVLFRLKYDSAGPSNNGFWTTLAIAQGLISGAAGSTPVDVVSATEMYIAVDSTRRLKLDVTAGTIGFTAITQTAIGSLVSCRSSLPIKAFGGTTCLQVFDPTAQDYVTVGNLTTGGVLSIGVPWRQRATVGDFE